MQEDFPAHSLHVGERSVTGRSGSGMPRARQMTNLRHELPLETAVGDQTHAICGDLRHTLSAGKSVTLAEPASADFAFILIR